MGINIIFLFLFSLIICISCYKDTSSENFEFIEKNKKITITNYIGEAKDLIIPKKIKKLPVTVLEDEAFAFKQLTSVTIPDTVAIIGNHTFSNNRLTVINLPNSVTYIGKYAFSWNQLTSIEIPDSVSYIDEFAFLGSKLTKINLPKDAEIELNAFNFLIFDDYIKNGKKAAAYDITFSTYDNFNIAVLNNSFSQTEFASPSCAEIVLYTGKEKDVIIPAMINNYPVTAIGYSSFFGQMLTNITIPDSVTIIGPWAFAGNNLNNITIPDSVKIICEHSFRESRIASAVISNSLEIIGENAFTHNQLTEITLPNSLTVIGDSAFTYNELKSISLPNSIESIGNFAFVNNQITDVKIPESISSLGLGIFDANVNIEFE